MSCVFGKTGTLVLRRESRHLHRLVNECVNHRGSEVRRVGCCRSLSDKNTQHELSRSSLLQRFNFAHAYPYGEAVIFTNQNVGRSRSVLCCPLNDVLRRSLQIRHSLFRSTDSNLSNLDGWEPNTNRNRLSVLPADSDALIQLQITPNGRHLTQNRRAIADQRCTFYRRGDVSIFDEIGFACGKYEFTARYIDLAAAELYCV